MEKDKSLAKKFYIDTFGCQMNKLDSELISEILIAEGFEETRLLRESDIILINSCSVRKHAEDRVYSRTGTLKFLKKRNPGLIIGIIGCMAEREKEKIFTRLPHVNLVCGPSNIAEITDLVNSLLEHEKGKTIVAIGGCGRHIERVHTISKKHLSGFISVVRGCDRFCSYCIVPYVRGRKVSREIEDVVHEAESLLRSGVKEITLLGQDINSYHTSAGKKFPELLQNISPLPGLVRLRFITSHPASVDRQLFEAMRDLHNVCAYLHLPAQSGSDKILKDMNRGYTRDEF
ncbi:MAG: MiaB/RimO family radical SAM methylthiotransferase, partial [Planctomycetota bacterium]